MKFLLTNKICFGILFFIILFFDIYVKTNLDSYQIRIVTKSLVVISLIAYFLINKNNNSKNKYVIIGLLCFLIGDLLLIFFEITALYIIGLVLFVAGKLCYVYRFSNERDFSMLSLTPFFVLCFLYMIFIMHFVMNNLGAFFIPTLLYLFACLSVILFAYLRKNEVNYKSFIIVLIGVVVATLCDSISVLQSFYYQDFPYHKFLIMFLYGLSQYLIVSGLIEEQKPYKL
ncbi:lysoplasmalogenase family protein [Lacinutrix chionoecetis]